MDRFQERIDQAKKALAALQELTALRQPSIVQRDALLLRFMLATEAIWKAVQRHLQEEHEIEVGSPRESLRSTLAVGGLSAEQAEEILFLLRDRNLIVHTYNEKLAAEVVSRIPAHAKLLEIWLSGLKRA
ncbi:MAG: nucleotidyltransferase [Planctomycetes bacterium]|nr:nucleotidyltransferase [Planctomycetota bacterium]